MCWAPNCFGVLRSTFSGQVKQTLLFDCGVAHYVVVVRCGDEAFRTYDFGPIGRDVAVARPGGVWRNFFGRRSSRTASMAQSIMHDSRDGLIAGEVREKQARRQALKLHQLPGTSLANGLQTQGSWELASRLLGGTHALLVRVMCCHGDGLADDGRRCAGEGAAAGERLHGPHQPEPR